MLTSCTGFTSFWLRAAAPPAMLPRSTRGAGLRGMAPAGPAGRPCRRAARASGSWRAGRGGRRVRRVVVGICFFGKFGWAKGACAG